MRFRLMVAVMMVTLPFCDVGVSMAFATKIKFEKTEVEKARGKCVRAVLGGALLGALVGAAVSKKGAATGAGIGAAAGIGTCAVIMANAKRADRIIAAQIASAQYQDAVYTTTFEADDSASTTTFEGKAGASEGIDSTRLRPVRYMALDGSKLESPVLAAGEQDCRAITASIGGSNNVRADLPTQYVCRTPEGDYRPYGVKMASSNKEEKKAA